MKSGICLGDKTCVLDMDCIDLGQGVTSGKGLSGCNVRAHPRD